MSLKKVIACVRKNKNFLITSHTNLEGDALGAELAFYWLLKVMGKNAVIVNEDKLPYAYEFLPGVNKIQKNKKNLKVKRFDCFIILDCSDLSRCGEVYKLNTENKAVVNIDHHISNTRFGNINWVEPETSSTCQMLYKLYKKLGISLTKSSALALYVGILTDTGSFKYANTTSATHQAVAELLRYNFTAAQIYKNLYANIPFSDTQLLLKVLPKIKREAGGRIVCFEIKRDMLKDKKISSDLGENILTFGRSIKDVEVVVLFKENLGARNEIRVNFRSQGKVDVHKVAAYFGGGGHRTASGATIKGSLVSIRRRVLEKIKESLK